MAVRRSIPLLVFAAMFLCVSAKAADIGEYRYAITKACDTWGVPERLVYAIAKQESGHNPWAVNVAGQGFTPKSKEEALKIANRAWTQGRSFDVGLMQINSYWLKKLGFSPEYAIEPRRNIFIGTWILANEIARFGLGWKAIASYHTPVDKNPERAKNYALSIIGHLYKLPAK